VAHFYQPGTRETKYSVRQVYTSTYIHTTPSITMASTSAQALSNGKVSELQQSGDFSIKSESVTPKLGSSIRILDRKVLII